MDSVEAPPEEDGYYWAILHGAPGDELLNDVNLESACPLDNGHHTPVAPRHDLGALDTLPLELLQSVLAQLDILSLTDFRRVSRRAMQVVDSVPQYRDIVAHAPNLLRGILSAETGRWMTCETLFDTICTAKCTSCPGFGAYISLLTCTRVCFDCIEMRKECHAISIGHAAEVYGLESETFNALPYMKNIPGHPRGSTHPAVRQRFADADAVQQAAIETTTQQYEPLEPDVPQSPESPFSVFDQLGIEPDDGRWEDAPYSPPLDQDSLSCDKFLSFGAVLQTPVFDRSTRKCSYGLHCIACCTSIPDHPFACLNRDGNQ